MPKFMWLVLVASSCAGMRPVERGEWKLVFVDSAKRDAEAKREVIPRDDYERETAGGLRRAWEPPPGFLFPLLHEVESIGLTVGEVHGFRVDEREDAAVYLDGAVVQPYWGPVQRRDAWEGDNDVTYKESALYLRGLKPGQGVIRVIRGNSSRDVPITVR